MMSLTREQIAYWRLNDPLCGTVLKIGKDPNHFPLIKVFFPFIREASVLQVPCETHSLPFWLTLAFYSGFLFGQHRRFEAEELLKHNQTELDNALRTVRMLSHVLDFSRATPTNLHSAFQAICRKHCQPLPILHASISAAFESFKSGLAAATLGKADPSLAEFVDPIHPPVRAPWVSLTWRSMMWSPLLIHSHKPWPFLAHPLPRLAATYYPHAGQERKIIVRFFIEQLKATGENNEDACPSAKNDILGWITNALRYGRKIKSSRAKSLNEILSRIDEAELAAAERTVCSFMSRAGGTRPEILAQAVLGWYNERFTCGEDATYGRFLERVVHCSDFAIWVSWLSRTHK